MRAQHRLVRILRDARTPVRTLRVLFSMRAPQDEDSIAFSPAHDLKQPISFPRRVFRARGLQLCFAHPESRGGRSAEKRSGACEAPVGRIMCVTDARERAYDAIRQALARRLASHDAGRSPLGAPPWRFWAPGAALLSPAFAPDRLQRAPRTQVVVLGGRGPCLPRRTVTSRRRRTPRLAPHSGSSLEHALNEQGWEAI